MALIFSPLSEDVLQGPYTPIPKGVFLMLHLGEGVSQLESEMHRVVEDVLVRRKFKPIRANREPSQKDYLDKIIQLIRGCGFGTAIFSEYTPASTLANIFFEVAICNLLGKPVVIAKSKDARSPSDFVRTEWVAYSGGKKSRFRSDYAGSVSSIKDLATYYDKLGDIALEAEDVDFELAFERYRQSYLISGVRGVRDKILSLRDRSRSDDDPGAVLKPVRTRLRTSISEFSKFIQAA